MIKVDLSNPESILNENFNSGGEGSDNLVQEDPANDAIICEQLLLESFNAEELQEMIDEGFVQELVDAGVLQEKTIVKFDKHAKLSRGEAQAELAIAREKGDRDYKKLVTVWKLRKLLLNKIHTKYGNQAKARARQNKKKLSAFPKLAGKFNK